MFIVTDTITFTHQVKVLVPTDGGHERQDFKATFNVIDPEKQDSFDLGTTEGSTAFLRDILVGMEDLVDAANVAVPYSDKVRDQLLRFQFVRIALVRAYFDAVQKAPEGN